MLSVFFFLCCDFGFFFEGQLCIGAVKVKLKGPLTCAYNESTAGCKGTMPREGGGDSHMEQTGMLVGNFEFNP